MAEKTERAELETVDINEITFTEQDEFPEGFNPSEDAFEQAPPVPDGRYKLKLVLQEEDAYQSWDTDSGKKELKANIVAEIVNVIKVPDAYREEKLEGAKVFASVTTSIPRGKSTCTMAGLLRELMQDKKYAKVIEAIPTSKQKLLQVFDKVVKMEPILGASTVWEAWEEGKQGWKCVKKGMENFPKGKDGKYSNVVKGKEGEVTAKAKIKRWFGSDTEKLLDSKVKGGGEGVKSKPMAPRPPAPEPSEPEIIEDTENV